MDNCGRKFRNSCKWQELSTLQLLQLDATSFAVQSGSLPGGASLNASTGAITGTETGSTATTTYSFTIRATDAQGQTADRAFTITISHGASGGGQFN